MNTFHYKDYIGTFNYVEEDDILYGKIEGITDLVTFEGSSIAETRKAFLDAVDDYLELCKEAGKDPMKSFKGSFNIRIQPSLHRKAAIKAARQNLNLNQFVQKAIEKAVDDD